MVAFFFWIPSIPLCFVGCYYILPMTFPPVLHRDQFKAGVLLVDSMYYISSAEGGSRPTIYSMGYVGEDKEKLHELKINRRELHPSYAYEGKEVSVYYHPRYKRVYYRRASESPNSMPLSKVFGEFLFWTTFTVLPFPAFFYVYLRTRRQWKREKLAAKPREQWVKD